MDEDAKETEEPEPDSNGTGQLSESDLGQVSGGTVARLETNFLNSIQDVMLNARGKGTKKGMG